MGRDDKIVSRITQIPEIETVLLLVCYWQKGCNGVASALGQIYVGDQTFDRTSRARPIEELPTANNPDLDLKSNGEPPSATPIPISRRSIGR